MKAKLSLDLTDDGCIKNITDQSVMLPKAQSIKCQLNVVSLNVMGTFDSRTQPASERSGFESRWSKCFLKSQSRSGVKYSRGREKVVRMVKPKAQIENRVNLSGLNTNARNHHSPGSKSKGSAWIALAAEDHKKTTTNRGRISLAQDERFRLDCSSGKGDRGVWISLTQVERFRLDCSSGREDRGARISLAQDEMFRLDCSSGERRRGAWIALAQGDFLA
ncbi:hypothetical protein J6590_050588 [Homalodisca vitripennis]|nr:hypothetical protein J6590_050588 [Homalodisca vitripennis]